MKFQDVMSMTRDKRCRSCKDVISVFLTKPVKWNHEILPQIQKVKTGYLK
jgi:hypothetical protein